VIRPTISRLTRALALGSVATVLAGCSFGGLHSLNMPGTRGHGPGSFTISVQLPDVATLPQNSPVLVNDVTVGSVSGIAAVQDADGSFHATVQLSLDAEVNLPANATATVAQTSLLGSQHVALLPPNGPADERRLSQGDVIELGSTGRYPTTEEVLSSLGMVVNKGNIGALEDITEELYAGVANRSGSFVDLIPRLAELTGSLQRQTTDILAAADGLNRFSGILARNRENLGRALETMPDALRVLNKNRAEFIAAFAALGRVGTVAANMLDKTKEDFGANLKDLYPVVKALNDNAEDFVKDLTFLPTFPFHTKYLRQAVRGDYLNVYATFDMTARRMGEAMFGTSGLDPNMKHMSEILNAPDFVVGASANLSGQAADPFKIPAGTATQWGGDR